MGRCGRIAVALAWAALAAPAQAAELRVIDGDTFEAGGQTIRLLNIDAPEIGQSCTGADGRAYDCGAAAADALAALLAAGPVRCEGLETDQYGRRLARCAVAGSDLGARMVATGQALAFRRYSDEYVGEELDAAKAGRGIWAGGFAPPWEYRAARWADADKRAPDPGCPIKGNVNAKGERIYHTPWSRSYAKTRINTARGERWFCNEAEARAAGWRAPYR